jgi:hypothetical protein
MDVLTKMLFKGGDAVAMMYESNLSLVRKKELTFFGPLHVQYIP